MTFVQKNTSSRSDKSTKQKSTRQNLNKTRMDQVHRQSLHPSVEPEPLGEKPSTSGS